MSDTPAKPASDWQTYKRLLAYLKPRLKFFLISVSGYWLYAMTQPMFAWLMQFTLEAIENIGSDIKPVPIIGGTSFDVFDWTFTLPSIDLSWLGVADYRLILPLTIVGIFVVRGFGAFLGNFYIAKVANWIVLDLRTEIFNHLLHLPSQYYDKSTSGHLVSRVTYNVSQVMGAVTDAVTVIIREGLTVIALFSFLFYVNWQLTLVFLLAVPVIGIVVGYAGKRFRRIAKRIQHSMGDITHVAGEVINGYKEVRIFGGVDAEGQRFLKAANNNFKQAIKMEATKAITTPVIQTITASALGFLIWMALDPSLSSGMSGAQFVAYLTAAGLLAKPIRQLSEVNATLQKGLAAAHDIFDLLNQPLEQNQGKRALADVRGDICISDLTFAYQDMETPVLKNISMQAKSGQIIALVGRSGSGKSTLVNLLPRFYEVEQGSIEIDGHNITEFGLADLRRQIALVTQQVTLFNASIRDNIAYGEMASASEEQIQKAIKDAYADEFINQYPLGLDTMIGDDGVLLSGGQRQRLAIARALLKNAPILILDEATSALDSEAENQIQAALENVMQGRTTFVIAHRLSTIENADEILVMADGEIVERGNHKSLLANNAAYASLHRNQFKDQAPSEDSKVASTLLPKSSQPIAELSAKTMVQAWYQGSSWLYALLPLSWLFGKLSSWRRMRLVAGNKRWQAPVPVIVVGNITVGGTGKTPLVLHIVRLLQQAGYKPGILSRGYKSKAAHYPHWVSVNDQSSEVGDEPLLLAQRSNVPVVIDPDRVGGAKFLLAQGDCDVIVSDDGLQHYALARHIEIAVIDGARGLGNRMLLPAGPLREKPARLAEVDFVVTNGHCQASLPAQPYAMQIKADELVNLNSRARIHSSKWQLSRRVHAVAGIGNPARFFTTLAELGFEVIEHVYADHHQYQLNELQFDDGLPVVMTEKDAVKCLPLIDEDNYWYLQISANLEDEFNQALLRRVTATQAPQSTETESVS